MSAGERAFASRAFRSSIRTSLPSLFTALFIALVVAFVLVVVARCCPFRFTLPRIVRALHIDQTRIE
ncbi:hypothetical protein [Paraburkholderia bannensis]|uniref:hypothetical protein n=1 Tax=Paraburkholderia bannensis TaxID=765414 RepID=UPI002ABE6A96|nr:hypothetical protein [Paraburkholderia bannensis]